MTTVEMCHFTESGRKINVGVVLICLTCSGMRCGGRAIRRQEALLTTGLPGFVVHKIKRVENRRLWTKYARMREDIEEQIATTSAGTLIARPYPGALEHRVQKVCPRTDTSNTMPDCFPRCARTKKGRTTYER